MVEAWSDIQTSPLLLVAGELAAVPFRSPDSWTLGQMNPGADASRVSWAGTGQQYQKGPFTIE